MIRFTVLLISCLLKMGAYVVVDVHNVEHKFYMVSTENGENKMIFVCSKTNRSKHARTSDLAGSGSTPHGHDLKYSFDTPRIVISRTKGTKNSLLRVPLLGQHEIKNSF